MGKKILIAWICLAAVAVAAGYLFTYQEKIRVNLDRIAQTQQRLALIYDLQNNLLNAQAAVRGFILTGEAKQLEGYEQLIKDVNADLGELAQVTSGDPKAQRLVVSLQPLVQQRLELLQKIVDLRRQQGIGAPDLEPMTRDGARLQDRIRKSLEKLEYEEKKLLDPGWAREQRRAKQWLWGLGSITFVSFTLLLCTMYFLNREIYERKRAEEKLASYQEDLRSLASQLSLAEERERRRIAVYLHDQIGHSLALANIKVQELQKAAGTLDPASLSGELTGIGSLMKQAAQDTHTLTFRISPPILYELGLEAALEWLTEQLPAQYGISATFRSDGHPQELNEDVRILLFQAVSELLVNAVKHSQAQHLQVSLWQDAARLHLRVTDDGQGYQVSEANTDWRGQRGFGLFSIRERLRPFGGILEVQSRPGAGTQVTLSVPVS